MTNKHFANEQKPNRMNLNAKSFFKREKYALDFGGIFIFQSKIMVDKMKEKKKKKISHESVNKTPKRNRFMRYSECPGTQNEEWENRSQVSVIKLSQWFFFSTLLSISVETGKMSVVHVFIWFYICCLAFTRNFCASPCVSHPWVNVCSVFVLNINC